MSGAELETVWNRGSRFRAQIRDLLCQREYASETKTHLLVAYLDIALEHHEAVALLIKTKLYGSAFALVRPLLETLFRALWINGCATPDQVQEVAHRDDTKFPRMDQLVAIIDQTYATDNFFASIKNASWAAMCSFTHSGLSQLVRRFTDGDVKPNYRDVEIVQVLNNTNTAIILLSRMFFLSADCENEAATVEKMLTG
jgi:hypothetical protein